MTDNYHQEWLKRKARRVAKQAINARLVETFHKDNRSMRVMVAERSRGYQTDYKRVPTYFLLVYENSDLIHGQTMTECEWQKQRPEYVKICS